MVEEQAPVGRQSGIAAARSSSNEPIEHAKGEEAQRPRSGDYDVGYCRPPKATQFKAGQSGNPKGRPKGSLNTRTLVAKILDDKIAVKINGRMKNRSIREVSLQQQGKKAASGDAKALQLLLGLEGQTGSQGTGITFPDASVGGGLVESERTLLAYELARSFRTNGLDDALISAALASLGLRPDEGDDPS